MISLLWAESINKVIGKDNKLPWNIKEEMAHFVSYTKNKTILMGRNTWESLSKKPLPNRKNILITSRPLEKEYNNIEVSGNLEQVVKRFKNNEEELVVIGGKKIYQSIMDLADRLVISVIHQEYQGDTYAPEWNEKQFSLVSKQVNELFTIYIYERV